MTWCFLALGVAWLLAALHDLIAIATLPELPALAADAPQREVTVVLAVRDDGPHVAEAVRHLLAQERVNLHLIVVDDRSSDDTATILARLATTDPRLNIVAVRELPPDWLGKSHALHQGAATVTTPWLLFADGDARLSPDALARAIDAAERTGTDHVSLLPTHRNPSFLGQACLLGFQLIVQRRVRAVNGTTQRSYVGTGAFNLVRTSAYRAIGGHLPLRLEVVDDVFLGYLLFRGGFRSRVWFAARDFEIDWGGTPGHLLHVVEKNMFAMLRFRTWIAVLLLALTAIVLGATLAGPWLAGTAGWFALIAYLLTALPAIALARRMAWNPLAGLLVPIARLWLPIALINSTFVTLRQGGVRWRGTFYPLRQLRSGQVGVR
jgi:glycosyltransferase involved in cell wall biosynthesis